MYQTPRLTDHARQRCEQMGISTKRAKRIVIGRTTTYRGSKGNSGMVCQSADPDFSVVWDPESNTILTVVPRVSETYRRTADGFETVDVMRAAG